MTTSPSISTSLEQIVNAVNALNTSNDKQTRKEANVWLEEFQKKPEAWTFAQSILQADVHSFAQSVVFFAVQTLRIKTEYDLQQLALAERLQLRDTLLSLLKNHVKKPESRAIVHYLCLAIADLAAQLDEWDDPVKFMVESLSGSSQTQPELVAPLLKFLAVYPEELYENTRLPLSNHEVEVRGHNTLSNNSANVIQLLLHYMQTSGNKQDVVKGVFECLVTWMRHREIRVSQLLDTPLLQFAFEAIRSNDFFDDAVDLICQIIDDTGREIVNSMPISTVDHTSPTTNGATTPPHVLMVIEKILAYLANLQPLLQQAIQEEDSDMVRGFCRIYSAAGESFMLRIITHVDAFETILHCILQCTMFQDLEIVPITFGFWAYLTDQVHSATHMPQHSRDKFVSLYVALFNAIVKHIRYPDDLGSWTASERDEFRDFRHTMGDVLKDCVRILGEQTSLELALNMLTNAVNSAGTNATWQDVEAPLFALRAMGSKISETENVVMPRIMQLFSSLPDHPKIRYCAILVVGRYSEWTKLHPDYLAYQLTFISKGFEEKGETQAAAAQALNFLCESCGPLLIDFLPQLQQFYQTIIRDLATPDRRDVTQGLAFVLGSIPPERLLTDLQQFTLPLAQELHSLANSDNASVNDAKVQSIKSLLDQFSILFRNIKPNIPDDQPHPVVNLLVDIWPVLSTLFDRFNHYSPVVENLCKVIHHATKSYGPHLLPLLPNIMNTLAEQFSKRQENAGPLLWASKAVVLEFLEDVTEGKSPADVERISVIWRFVETMVVHSCDLVKRAANSKKLEDIPEIVEDLFDLACAIVDVSPHNLVRSNLLQPLFETVTAASAIQQSEASKAVLCFAKSMTELDTTASTLSYEQSAPLRTLIQHKGRDLVNILMKALLYILPGDAVAEIAPIFKYIGERSAGVMVPWVVDLLNQILPAAVTNQERQDFLDIFSEALKDREISRTKSCLRSFADLVRRKQILSRHTPPPV